MEVAIGPNSNSTPFQREVREWQRVDPNTGALLSGRLEADRWINGPLNAYGKIVNSQNISQPNGSQQSQRNQLEVLQARTSSGSLQVVRAQTVKTMTSTSSNRWPSSSTSSPSSSATTGISTAYHTKKQIFGMDGQHFSNGYHDHLTNGDMSADSHEHQLTTPLINNYNNHHLFTTPSAKLSTLMKSNTAATAAITNGRDRNNSPHFRGNSMSLLQRHEQELENQQQHFRLGNQQQHKQQYESETQSSSFADGRYHHPTITVGEVRVGVNNNTNPMKFLPNERETILDRNKEELLSHHHRGRSISTDDLTTEWNQSDNEKESSEWRRVSKIRRSFQFPKSTSPKLHMTRPIDLPENSGSVSRIRHELENGRRLNAAMKGNHVDLVALNSILNGTHETENKTTKKATFLTAESLKEIRGKLKKLSDESLYKDDFITHENIDKSEAKINHDSNGYSIQQPIVLQDAQVTQQVAPFQYHPKLEGNYTTNSLENRTKYRDTNSSEWHLRRKSYGFEKMTSSENLMFRMETSTDSGIGRSGDLTSWSPTEKSSPSSISTTNPVSIQKTTVTLTNGGGITNTSERPVVIHRRNYNNNNGSLDTKSIEIKRHSIAVDETKYVGGENVRKAFEAKSSTVHLNGITDETGRRQKRVEFCKTEVHFAAESGKVNIVETDGKPPPTNNFRRRRRNSSSSSSSSLGNNLNNSYLEAINSGIPLIHFGDEQKVLFEKESDLDYKNNVTISIPIKNENNNLERSLKPKTVIEIEDESNSDEISLRSILKNKPVKPRPYHLGENVENSESLWGVRLKPVSKVSQDNREKEFVKTDYESDSKELTDLTKSVAEKGKRKDGSGYSTKINLNLSNSPYSWEVADSEVYIEEKPTTVLRLEDSSSSSSATPPKLSTQLTILHDNLKSTSLIMKTMRLTNQIENDNEKMNHINSPREAEVKLNATNSLTLIKSDKSNNNYPKYPIINNETANGNNNRVKQLIITSKEKSTSPINFEYNNKPLFNCEKSQFYHHGKIEILKEEEKESNRPIAAPRIQVIGSSNAISHQLSQLRQIYDSSGHESDDSAKADEEVNHIFRGAPDKNLYNGTLEDNSNHNTESWSRIKAKRIMRNQEDVIKEDVEEYPKTNIMSIELHSPSSTLTRIVPSQVVPKKIEIPIPKPRTVSPVKIQRNTLENDDIRTIKNIHESETERKLIKKVDPNREKEPLKVVTGGARKLREHELSYFGIKTADNQESKTKNNQPRNISSMNSNTWNSQINNKKVLNNENNVQKWNLSNDKPDLLRHSPIIPSKVITSEDPEPERRKLNNDDGPIYENLKKPSTYSRKKDLKRDEMILDEMTKTADQILKTVNKCSNSSKNQDHEQLQKPTKPLDTIDEKLASHHSSDTQVRVKSKAPQTSRHHNSDSFQRSCCSNRASSASSIESLNRYSSSKSRSHSKESSNGKIEYANIRPTKKLSSSLSSTHDNKSRHRSQSRERQQSQQRTRSHSHNSSSDDLANNPKVELIPRIKKSSRTRDKELASTKEKDRKRSGSGSITKMKVADNNNDHHYKNYKHSSRSTTATTTDDRTTKFKRPSHASDKSDKTSLSRRSSPASTIDHHHHPHYISHNNINNHSNSNQHSKVRTKSSGTVSSTSSSSRHRMSKEHTRK